jgi:hypothetical protein
MKVQQMMLWILIIKKGLEPKVEALEILFGDEFYNSLLNLILNKLDPADINKHLENKVAPKKK